MKSNDYKNAALLVGNPHFNAKLKQGIDEQPGLYDEFFPRILQALSHHFKKH